MIATVRPWRQKGQAKRRRYFFNLHSYYKMAIIDAWKADNMNNLVTEYGICRKCIIIFLRDNIEKKNFFFLL